VSAGVVLLITSDFPPVPGGQSRYLYDLWCCLPAGQVVILAPAVEGAQEVDRGLGCRVVRVCLPLGEGRLSKLRKSWLLLRSAWGLCRSLQVRLIHCGQVFSAGFAGCVCRLLRGVPYHLYVYGADLLEYRDRPLWGRALRFILGRARLVIAISQFTRREVEKSGVPPERIELLHPAIDLERFAALPDPAQVRRRYGWQVGQVILSVGRLVERKGQDMVVRSLPQVARAVPGVRYAIAGEGPYRQELERLAREAGVEERVEFLGFVSEAELLSLYAAADVFAMPSRERPEAGDAEGFGIVFIEANAAGLAVLAGRSGGVEDAVVDGCTGLLVDPADPQAIAQGLIRLLQDNDLRGRLASQGRERARGEFDRRARAARLWELCR